LQYKSIKTVIHQYLLIDYFFLKTDIKINQESNVFLEEIRLIDYVKVL